MRRIFFYLFLYFFAQYLSRLASNDRIPLDQFLKDFQSDASQLSKFKNFQDKSLTVFKFLKSLLLNKHSYRALTIISMVATVEYSCFFENQLLQSEISKAIKTGIYTEPLLEILKKHPDLLKVAVNENFVNMVNEFSFMQMVDVPRIISDINDNTKIIIQTGDASLIYGQIVCMMSLIFIKGDMDRDNYVYYLLKFLSGQGISPHLKTLLKTLIEKNNIIFLTKFFDF